MNDRRDCERLKRVLVRVRQTSGEDARLDEHSRVRTIEETFSVDECLRFVTDCSRPEHMSEPRFDYERVIAFDEYLRSEETC